MKDPSNFTTEKLVQKELRSTTWISSEHRGSRHNSVMSRLPRRTRLHKFLHIYIASSTGSSTDSWILISTICCFERVKSKIMEYLHSKQLALRCLFHRVGTVSWKKRSLNPIISLLRGYFPLAASTFRSLILNWPYLPTEMAGSDES